MNLFSNNNIQNISNTNNLFGQTIQTNTINNAKNLFNTPSFLQNVIYILILGSK